MNKRRSAFTLVEILVVLAIIAILAALLFPAFGRARESARQTNCASNLQQIGFAVLQYRKDEGRYPDSLLDLMGEGVKYNYNGATATIGTDQTSTATPKAATADKGTGYFKGGQDVLVCPNDDTLTEVAFSSYGFLSKGAPTTPLPPPQIPSAFNEDLGKYVWNYWGYRRDGFAYPVWQAAGGNTPPGSPLLTIPTAGATNLPYNPRINGVLQVNPTLPENVLKYSMSNRFAPPTTIITHCIYHRVQTANNVNLPGELYGTDPELDSKNAKDIVLRIDGSAKAVDVSQWNPTDPAADSIWQKQMP